MPRISRPKKFKSEAEEAEWLSSPVGRRSTSSRIDKDFKEGKGSFVRDTNVQRTDAAALKRMIERAKEKSQPTEAISVRLPTNDLAVIRKWSKNAGIGYQTLIKEAVHELAQRLSLSAQEQDCNSSRA